MDDCIYSLSHLVTVFTEFQGCKCSIKHAFFSCLAEEISSEHNGAEQIRRTKQQRFPNPQTAQLITTHSSCFLTPQCLLHFNTDFVKIL